MFGGFTVFVVGRLSSVKIGTFGVDPFLREMFRGINRITPLAFTIWGFLVCRKSPHS